jgi:hypothetical protein
MLIGSMDSRRVRSVVSTRIHIADGYSTVRSKVVDRVFNQRRPHMPFTSNNLQ